MYPSTATEPLSRQGQGGSFTMSVPNEGSQPIYQQTATRTTVVSGQTPFAQQTYPTQVREQIGHRTQQTVTLGQGQPTVVQARFSTSPVSTTHVVTEKTTYREPIGEREPGRHKLACSFLTFILAAVCFVAFSIFFMMSHRHHH